MTGFELAAIIVAIAILVFALGAVFAALQLGPPGPGRHHAL